MSVWAVLACRARSERLYCKPLQLIAGLPILAHIVLNIRRLEAVDGIVLAVAEGGENECFVQFAEEHQLPYVVGPEEDIASRVLGAMDRFAVDTMFRVTTECPFLFSGGAREIVAGHIAADRDFTTILNLPLGTTYELIHRRILREMIATGDPRYRAALSVYARDHQDRLRVETLLPPLECRRPEVNLAIDHPGQLVFCRRAYGALMGRGLPIGIPSLIQYYDSAPIPRSLVTSIHEDVWAIKPDQTMARAWE
jgi:spore coat polysaccharide biosynthesis protein SpsF